MIDPTPRQVRALYEVHCFTVVHGRVPTYRQLAALLGTANPGDAHRLMHYAGKKGLHVDRVLTDAGRVAVGLLLGG